MVLHRFPMFPSLEKCISKIPCFLCTMLLCACKRWMKTKRHQFNVSEGSVLILLRRHSDVPRYVFFCYHGPIAWIVCVCGVYVCLQWCTSLCFCQWSAAPKVVTTRLWYRRRLPSFTSRHNWSNLRKIRQWKFHQVARARMLVAKVFTFPPPMSAKSSNKFFCIG